MPLRINVGSYTIVWEGEWSVVAAYDACLGEEEAVALDHALSRVVYGP